MFSGDCCYILDANAIRMLSYEQILDSISRKIRISTIDEVNYEVRSLEKAKILKVEKLSAASYEKMVEIINNSENVRKIISYYDNKGAADIALLAYALCPNDLRLFQDELIIVTNDKGLRKACEEFKIKWMSVVDFLHL